MKIRLADYVSQMLAAHGVTHVFLVTGGGAMHLNDAFARTKELACICCHHEQACAMAAESFARTSGKMAVVNPTSGPGGINTLNGVFGAWTDSIPMLVVSGQIKRETCMDSYKIPGLRQLGDQEADIVSMVKGITKYSVLVQDPLSIRYHLEKALFLANHGRPGPCWVDIPIDVQASQIDPEELQGFSPPLEPDYLPLSPDYQALALQIQQLVSKAKRPVILVGSGVRIGGAVEQVLELAERWQIPLVTAWNAHDAVPDNHPSYIGRPGFIGDRPGNWAVQNSDLLLALGSRLNIRQTSYNWKSFAREAFKIVVDIDAAELKKPTFQPDLPIHGDVKPLLECLLGLPPFGGIERDPTWMAWCHQRREKYPVLLPEYWKGEDAINPYCFVSTLFDKLESTDAVVCGDGTACVTTFQAAKIKKGQRLYTNSGSASMGYDLPAAIGACFARKNARVICIAGDGSIQMNLQELQTIVTYGLPIKIFVLNNKGYHSIRQTQAAYFPDNIIGCGTESGLGFPNFEKLAGVYGYPYYSSRSHGTMGETIAMALASKSFSLCEIFLDLNQQFAPRLSSKQLPDGRMVSSPLEDMHPFLSAEELKTNMLIPVIS